MLFLLHHSYVYMYFLCVQDAFIGYGGIVVRQKVKDNASWFVTDFQELINCLID